MSEHLEQIELYLSGGMSADEQLQFELDMKNDPQLQETVARFRLINDAMDVSVEDELRRRLKEMESNESIRASTPYDAGSRRLSYRLAAAASILLLVSFGVWFLVDRTSSALIQFSEREYIAYDYAQVRGEFSRQSDFHFDMNGNKANQAKAVEWLTNWLKKNTDDDEARFVLADALHKMKHNDQAKVELAIVMANHSVLWSEKAEWNYVLLSANDTWDDLANATLQSMITDTSHSYHRQAIALSRLQKK